MSIKLSPKHGVNPTMGRCMWCGESTNEIAMLGKLKGDEEAPRYSVLSYEPCDRCKETWNKGVALIECTPNQIDSRPPFTKDNTGEAVYPTGRYTVVAVEAANAWFKIEAKAGMKLALDEEVYKAVDEATHKLMEGGEDNELGTVSDNSEDNQ